MAILFDRPVNLLSTCMNMLPAKDPNAALSTYCPLGC